MSLWIEEEGSGAAVLFTHGGLGDSRLWEPVAHALADEFRCIRLARDARRGRAARAPTAARPRPAG